MFVAVYLKKKWIGIIMFFAISIIALIYRDEFGWVPFSIFGSLSIIITTMWIKTYLTLQENAKAYFRTISDPKTTLVIDDKEMHISNFNGMRRFTWDTVDRFVITEDFVIPIAGKIPLICLPKSELSPEVIAWFSSRDK